MAQHHPAYTVNSTNSALRSAYVEYGLCVFVYVLVVNTVSFHLIPCYLWEIHSKTTKWMLEIVDSTEPYTYHVFSIDTYKL